MTVESVPGPDGSWVRRASYPELPGCVAEAFSPVDAIELLEEARVRRIQEMLARGEPVPVPRPPLRSPGEPLDPERLRFARWLYQTGRLGEPES